MATATLNLNYAYLINTVRHKTAVMEIQYVYTGERCWKQVVKATHAVVIVRNSYRRRNINTNTIK